jgi:hypothetical protein
MVAGTQDVALAVDHHVRRAANALEVFLLVGMVMRRQALARVDEPSRIQRGPQLSVQLWP